MANSGPPIQGARARAHAEIRAAILRTASAHLASDGAASMSLRAIARELGMASSAIYRYFASREDLLTALIIEAYDDLGARTEAVLEASVGQAPRQRWVGAAMAIRTWALDHPHDYALLYGTPIPGYAAPDDTVVPGTRVSLALVSVVRDAAAAGRSGPPPGSAQVSAATSRSMIPLRDAIDLDVSDDVLLFVLLAWTQLFGLLTFELFGQTKGFVDDDEQLFRDAAATMATQLGLGD